VSAPEDGIGPGDAAVSRPRVLLFFIDGVGVGEDDPDVNPLATGEFPTLQLTRSLRPEARAGAPAFSQGLDASLGIPGLPQSATGQTSILTGINAPAAMGKHVSGFPGPTLRAILEEHSLLKRVREGGRDASFLNAYGPTFFKTSEWKRRLSATSLATMASGAPFRDWNDLLEGRAVVHDLTHWRARERGFDLPMRAPEEAGAIIAEEASKQDFSLFEYFETDRAGHDQDRERAMRCLGDLDRALQVVLSRVNLAATTVLVVSDHGNVEDGRVKTHTMNPAFFAAWGAMRGGAEPEKLTDLAPFILRTLRLPIPVHFPQLPHR
jgi:2,3-bisphosphoglycerate-independent phosphoglycerate mutase